MDRDAPPRDPADGVPPVAWETARAVGLSGAGLAGAAAAVGLLAAVIDLPWVANTARLVLVFVGAVAAGLAVSFRPDRWEIWGIGAATAGLAYLGTPPHWDSFRFLFAVLAAAAAGLGLVRGLPDRWESWAGVAAAAGVGFVLVPEDRPALQPLFVVLGLGAVGVGLLRSAGVASRLGAASVFLVFHFGGIFMATVSPPPTPWLVAQVYNRAYNQYLQFLYLRNAYHFYSPDPGPASILAALVKTEVGEEVTADGVRRPKYETRWVVLPTRPADIRDPMGLTYYRRLCLVEQLSRPFPQAPVGFERAELLDRRRLLTTPGSEPYYPLGTVDPDGLEYRLPDAAVRRFLLPSYARHLIVEETPDQEAAKRTTVKLYRLEHRTLTVGELTGKTMPGGKRLPPYHPSTYRPFFLGEFDALGRLVDPQEPMLYWILPVVNRPTPGPTGKDYTDYLSAHAGREFEWDRLR